VINIYTRDIYMYTGYIYITTNLINSRAYIGKKNKSTLDYSYYGSGTVLKTAIKKYGKENFNIKVLYWAQSVEELDLKEIELIELYSKTVNLYNIAKGGTGGDTLTNHPDLKQIRDKQIIGLTNWHHNMSEDERSEHGKKISNAKKNKSNGHTGLTHNAATKEKMSQASKDYTKTPEWKLAHAVAAAKRKNVPLTAKYKSVIIDNIEYESVGHAMIALNIKHRATFYKLIKQQKLQVVYK